MKKIKLLILALLLTGMANAQTQKVQGTVLDSSGEPVIGATIKVDGTKIGVITDIDGNFILDQVPAGAKVTVSYVGMKTQVMQATSTMRIQMKDDSKILDEVVAIGYGTAKAKDLTSPIAVVKGETLTNTPSSSPMTAMQGKVAGVNVVSSGIPGSGPTVHIRGNGSFSNSTPLYVVDGMFYDNINFLNSNDIAEMSVLKDASAAAIYGVRAANGVIIITTKKGTKNQAPKITYDGYVGVQKATNILKMADSNEYATMLLEANYNAYASIAKASIDRYGGSYSDSDFHNWTYGSNTDWYKELLRDAIITNHSINISGGNDKADYAVGMNYLYQNGIMKTDNNYKRLNFRASLDYDATSWLKVGYNGIFTNADQVLANSSAWQQAFNASPLYPVYDSENTAATPTSYTSPASIGYTANFYNPIATADYYNSKNNTKQFLSNFYAKLTFIPDKLSFQTSYGYDHSTIEGHVYIPKYYVSAWQTQSVSSLTKSMTTYNNSIWDNTLTYIDSWGKHNFQAMGGFSMRQENYRYLWGNATNVPGGKDEYLYLSQGSSDGITLGDDGNTYRGMSYFTRLNYNYAQKYYLMFTFRADGSSKYQQHWGYFPSVGASWVVTEENFMKHQHVLDYLKLRASWGKLGNDHVAASDGFASIATGNDASGVFGNTIFSGYQNTTYFSYLKWEVVNELNLGFNLSTFKNRLNMDLDYYNRMTNNAVISARLPFSSETLAGNYAKIRNRGLDIALTWNDNIGPDFKYHVGTNLSFLSNKVTSLSGASYIQGGETFNVVGEEMNCFYGYKVVGVYQNEEEIKNDPVAVANNLEPGDFKYEDVNKDGKIDGSDRQALGSYQPNFTYGFNLGFNWKDLDFEVTTYGQAGAQMYNRKRALRYAQSNYNFDEAQYKDRWTGENSTNTDPSAKALTKNWNVGVTNSYFVESANYFRIQNITLGYTLKDLRFGTYTLPSMRLSMTADRPLTIFSAHAFSPEISDAEGWDTNVYPLTATYTFGVQINF
ncbi:MAG TPA: TonB-dependent receptor [Prevotella sp.]|nr:TonB-dependent receptor [Prevotella sp.]